MSPDVHVRCNPEPGAHALELHEFLLDEAQFATQAGLRLAEVCCKPRLVTLVRVQDPGEDLPDDRAAEPR